MKKKFDLKLIVKQFRVDGECLSIEPHGSGHINDTYLARFPHGDYIFQRINHHVFHNPPQMMENIIRVTRHIRKKMEQGTGLTPKYPAGHPQ